MPENETRIVTLEWLRDVIKERDRLKEENEKLMTFVNVIACHSDMCEVCQEKAKGIMAEAKELEESHAK